MLCPQPWGLRSARPWPASLTRRWFKSDKCSELLMGWKVPAMHAQTQTFAQREHVLTFQRQLDHFFEDLWTHLFRNSQFKYLISLSYPYGHTTIPYFMAILIFHAHIWDEKLELFQYVFHDFYFWYGTGVCSEKNHLWTLWSHCLQAVTSQTQTPHTHTTRQARKQERRKTFCRPSLSTFLRLILSNRSLVPPWNLLIVTKNGWK